MNTVRRTPDNLPADRPEINMASTKTQDAATTKTVQFLTVHFLLVTAKSVARVILSQQDRVQDTTLITGGE